MGKATHRRDSECCWWEFRASADAPVPFPQGERNQRLPGAGEVSMRRAGPRTPLMTSGLCRWSLAGALQDGVPFGSARNGPVENVPFSTTGLCLGVEGAAWVRTCFARGTSFGGARCEKASPERGGCPRSGRRGSVPRRRDHNQVYRRCAHFQAELSKRKGATQAPTALRERGSGGEALLSEKRPLPEYP